MHPKYEFDELKDKENIKKHGISLNEAKYLNISIAIAAIDTRFDYGETRFIATGLIKFRVHVMIYTIRSDKIRVISLRKANDREVKKYEAEKTN